MTKTTATIASLEARIVELEAVNKALLEQAFAAFAETLRAQLTAELQPLAAEVTRANERLDRNEAKFVSLVKAAAAKFEVLTATPVRAKTERSSSDYVQRSDWDTALASLRKESGDPDECWPREVVRARARELAATA